MSFTTVHGNDAIMRAAVEAKGDVKILAVTVLTSLDQGDLADLGFSCNVADLVLSRARRALEIGCDGVISSGLEAPRLREHLGEQVPGRYARHPPGLQQAGRRPEADGRHRGGLPRRRGLHRRRPPDPLRAGPPRGRGEQIQGRIAALFPA